MRSMADLYFLNRTRIRTEDPEIRRRSLVSGPFYVDRSDAGLFCPRGLKNLKFIPPIINQTVLLHSGHLGDHGAAANAQILGELLAVIGNRKAQCASFLRIDVEEGKNFFTGRALGDDFQLLIEEDIPLGDRSEQIGNHFGVERAGI